MPSYLYCAFFFAKLMCILDIIYSFIENFILQYLTIDTVDLFSERFIISFKLLTLSNFATKCTTIFYRLFCAFRKIGKNIFVNQARVIRNIPLVTQNKTQHLYLIGEYINKKDPRRT